MTKLTPKRRKVLAIIVGEPTIVQGCKTAGISKSTFYKWMESPVFRDEFERLLGQIADDAFAQIEQNLERSVVTLIRLLGNADPGIQRRAANDLLQHYLARNPPPQDGTPTNFKIELVPGEKDLESMTIEELEERLQMLRSMDPRPGNADAAESGA